MTYIIYGLVDAAAPQDIRYVGQTNNPARRLREHIKSKEGPEHHVSRWVRRVYAEGSRVEMVKLCETDMLGADAIERETIGVYRAYGIKLTNLTEGGTGWRHTPETRAKISRAQTGHVVSAVARAKLSAAHLGRKMSPEFCEKQRLAKTGKRHTDESKAKIGAAMRRLGIQPPMTDEVKRKISAAHMGRQKSAETRERMRAASTGRRHSEETKAKLAASRLGSTLSLETRAKIGASSRRSAKAIAQRARLHEGNRKRYMRKGER